MKLTRLANKAVKELRAFRISASGRNLRTAFLVAVTSLAARQLCAQEGVSLETADQIRKLSAEKADQHLPVRLRGVVTFFDESLYSRFIQDATAGIYLKESTNLPALVPGQFIEVEGETSRGEYAPVIIPAKISVLGEAALPSAKPASFEQLASGQEDSQFVEVHGIVRASYTESGYQVIEIATGGGRLTVYARGVSFDQTRELLDSTVRVRGVCSTEFNRQRQLFAIRLLVPRPGDFVIEKPATADPFAIPSQSIGSLLQFTPQGTYGHRVKVAGTLIYQRLGTSLFIQDADHGLFVQSKERIPLAVGDRVEVLGFPGKGEYTPILQDALYHIIGPGSKPAAVPIDLDQALKGTYDCRLVRMEATLLDRVRQSREQFLVLEAGDFVFHAYQEQEGPDPFAQLENGSQVAVTGLCLVEPGNEWIAGENWRAKSFRLLFRTASDVVVLQTPSWWTLRRLLWMVSLLGVIVFAAFVWVVVLRRRVHEQTEIIRQRLRMEAALKERYVDLFENANDMVYTHDLQGLITSINHAGEHLVGLGRDQILSLNIVDLIVPEQRAAARHWLEQVVKGDGAQTVEWDVAGRVGQRITLEISARLVEQTGRQVEVEGIARDITERKRLERELLEISNREQRRIGHDLHDGVCQQLVGIGYLTETLADRLQEKSAPESAEAERISYLLNHAILQTRGVARGLFPVRLEENGLVSALEELTVHASQLFQITCRFHCEDPARSVDNAIALHLYYIVQEAIANAAKHGKAKNVVVSLEPTRERHSLSVKDDGVGFKLPGSNQGGMGLRIMNYRARVIGASLEIKSQSGEGTQVICLFVPAFSGASSNSETLASTK